jgi:hypothetical protein
MMMLPTLAVSIQVKTDVFKNFLVKKYSCLKKAALRKLKR